MMSATSTWWRGLSDIPASAMGQHKLTAAEADAKLKHEEQERAFKKDLMQRHLLQEIAEYSEYSEDEGDEGDDDDAEEEEPEQKDSALAAVAPAAAARTGTKRKAEAPAPLEVAQPPAKRAKIASAAAAAAECAPSAPSAPSRRVLVLGMAFVNQEHADDAESKAKVETDSSIVRDRARLLALADLGFDVLTMNMAQSEAECEPGRHCEASYGRRAVTKLTKSVFNSSKQPLVLHSMMLDYFRFPGVYMRQAYASVFSEMIPALVECKALTAETVVYIPNLKDLVPAPLKSLKYLLEWRPIPATEYPLFNATDLVADKSKLGNYTNVESIKQLDAKFPFVAARFGRK